MAKVIAAKDFRTERSLMPDEAFLLVSGKRRGPTDPIANDVWNGIMHLPDDVALTTSSHHGSQLATLYSLGATGTRQSATSKTRSSPACWMPVIAFRPVRLIRCMASTVRPRRISAARSKSSLSAPLAISPRRTRIICAGQNRTSEACRSRAACGSCAARLRRRSGLPLSSRTAGPRLSMRELRAYAHARPDASDGEMWESNGPIYVSAAFSHIFEMQVSTFAASYVFSKIARPGFTLPKQSEFLFKTPSLLWHGDIAASYRAL